MDLLGCVYGSGRQRPLGVRGRVRHMTTTARICTQRRAQADEGAHEGEKAHEISRVARHITLVACSSPAYTVRGRGRHSKYCACSWVFVRNPTLAFTTICRCRRHIFWFWSQCRDRGQISYALVARQGWRRKGQGCHKREGDGRQHVSKQASRLARVQAEARMLLHRMILQGG